MSGRWTLGPTFVLRHAGFPFDWLEGLGVSDGFLAQVSVLLEAEQGLLAEARQAGGEKAASRAQEALEAGRAPTAPKGAAEWEAKLSAWREARAKVEAAYAAEKERLRAVLHGYAREPEVQEAVFLSSPDMFDNVWARYVASTPGPENADARRVERQVYSYLQRLCGKNETTSFFGPMGYGEIEGDGGVEVKVLPGKPRRRTFLAYWAVQELAKAVGKEKAFGPHLPLRKNPIFLFEAERVHCASLGLEARLGPDEARVVAALDGGAGTLAELAKALGTDVASAARMALPLLKCAAVVRGLRFPTEDLEVFSHLRAAVSALPEGEARTRWLGHFARLDGLRADFEQGDLAVRRAVLPRLEAAFTELTGVPARRGEGRMYTDRLVVYEEAASPFQLRFGKAYARALEEALSPALDLSAAFGARVQRGYALAVREKLGEGKALDFLGYASALRPDGVTGSQFSPVEPVSVPPAEGHEAQVPAELLGQTEGGRFSLPDVCLSARPDGTFDVLLARVHHHLLVWNWLCAFYPDRPRMERVARRWLSREPSAKPLMELALTRRNKGFYCFPGPRVAYTTAEALDLGQGGLSAADLTVRVEAEGPVLRDRSGARRLLYLPLADFSTYPPFAALAHPLVLHAPLRTGEAHVPRLRIGKAAYQRERWEVDVSSLAKRSGLELFLGVQREARRQGWPRFLFGRVPDERKPFLLDTASPFAHELMRHLARSGGRLGFEEMLPGPDGLFLRDGRGRYTFELRMQAERWSAGVEPSPGDEP